MLSRVASKRTAQKQRQSLDLPTSYPPPSSPPTDPLPLTHPRPSDVLLSRLHELKRLLKSLNAHFSALSSAEEAYGKALKAVSESQRGKGVRGEWLQGGLFLPPKGGGNGQGRGEGGGWAEWCGKVREETGKEAEAHLRLAKLAEEEVIDPLHRLYLGVKAFIADLDMSVNPLAEEVVRERETSISTLTHLSTSLATFRSTPLSLPASEDPLIVRSTAELQMRKQVEKENELLRVVLGWQEKTREFEVEVLGRAGSCWKWWAEESAKVHLDARQSLVKLTHQNESIAPDAEWRHFLTLNHLLPPKTPARSLDLLDYPHRDDPATKPLKEGVMERKKKWTREWKERFFVLTPAGYLHEYHPPTTPLSHPHLSLFLPACTVHPLSPATRSAGKERPAEFVIEGRKFDGGGGGVGTVKMGKGSLRIGSRETSRVYRTRGETEAAGWWAELEKLSKTSFTPHPGGASPSGAAPPSLFSRQGPAPTAVQQAGLPPAVVEHGEQTADEDEGEGGVSGAEEESPARDAEAVVAAAGVVGLAGEEEARESGKGKGKEVSRERSADEAGKGSGLERERKESMVTAFENLPPTQPGQGAQVRTAAYGDPPRVLIEQTSAPPSATEPVFPGAFTVDQLEKKAGAGPAVAVPAVASAPETAAVLPTEPTLAPPATQPAATSTHHPVPPPPQHPALAQQPQPQQTFFPPPVQDVSAARPPAEFVQPTAAHPAPQTVNPVSSPTAAASPPSLPPRQPAPGRAPAQALSPEAATTSSTLHPAPGVGTVEPAQGVMVDSSAPAASAGGAYPPPAAAPLAAEPPSVEAKEKKRRVSWFGFGSGGRK